ncbi:Piso0_004782 [Millerozyma farinosa CBS 7064]|uniref:Deoxyuridine 5'-triphosphate nucleotidohydrolase n=1 Tax=Pichia sorbitophila (strain ATCC MYA-4447 / BCRC 22081 / CBS 7064 / NBRC 10061 / NRRL Y-12695) TaxID=559304 RepID=G8Y3D2_PICSO|nr:Piso0_004782 [Millerozyma farinosa CBS 7064]
MTSSEHANKIQKLNHTAQNLKIHLRSKNAILPTKGSELAAGYDLYSSEDALIPAQGQGLVSTDISVVVPIGTYGRVAPRSGLAVKHGISTGAGVIDADYRGEVKIVLFNHSKKDFEIKKGDRIAQLVLERIVNASIKEIGAEELDQTTRGEGGFGSTGSN